MEGSFDPQVYWRHLKCVEIAVEGSHWAGVRAVERPVYAPQTSPVAEIAQPTFHPDQSYEYIHISNSQSIQPTNKQTITKIQENLKVNFLSSLLDSIPNERKPSPKYT